MALSHNADQSFDAKDIPLDQLPADFRQCILASANGESSDACDTIMGSKNSSYGYCAKDAHAFGPYCACVNANVQRPECVFHPCVDILQAYKTGPMTHAIKNKDCPKTVNCATVRAMGGEGNVATGYSIPPGCHGFQGWVIAHLSEIVLFLILVMILAIAYTYIPHHKSRRRPSRIAKV